MYYWLTVFSPRAVNFSLGSLSTNWKYPHSQSASWNDFRGPSVQALPLPLRVSLARARSLRSPVLVLPSAGYAGYLQINCIKCLASELFFLQSILPIAKTFSHRMIMRSLRTLLCPHYSMVTASLQCIMWKASLLISYLMTLQSLEKEISVFFFFKSGKGLKSVYTLMY